MPRKINDRTYGQKLIQLFVKLLFSGRAYYLTELAREMECSKQTVTRLIDDLSHDLNVRIEEEQQGRRRYVRIPRRPVPPVPLSEIELSLLQMCRDFTAHLLGRPLFEQVTQALFKSQALLETAGSARSDPFGTFKPGTIDYTPHYQTIRTLLQALEESRVLRLAYRSIERKRARVLLVQPLKMFSHRETIYLHARLAERRGQRSRKPEFDPLLAIHRIRKAELTDQATVFPADYDFEAFFNRHFGIIKDAVFEVEAELTGWAARYVTERIWSPGQKIVRAGPEAIRITFEATSEKEVLRWLFGFRQCARLLRPDHLVAEARATIGQLRELYP